MGVARILTCPLRVQEQASWQGDSQALNIALKVPCIMTNYTVTRRQYGGATSMVGISILNVHIT